MMWAPCLSSPSASFAFQRGGFVPRKSLAVKSLFRFNYPVSGNFSFLKCIKGLQWEFSNRARWLSVHSPPPPIHEATSHKIAHRAYQISLVQFSLFFFLLQAVTDEIEIFGGGKDATLGFMSKVNEWANLKVVRVIKTIPTKMFVSWKYLNPFPASIESYLSLYCKLGSLRNDQNSPDKAPVPFFPKMNVESRTWSSIRIIALQELMKKC